MFTFVHICEMIAARQCWDSGQSTRQIAESAARSPATIRRWIKQTGVRFLRRRVRSSAGTT
jgi:transposase